MMGKGHRRGDTYNIDPILEHTPSTRRYLADTGRTESNRMWTNI